jgi:hypothetical protein
MDLEEFIDLKDYEGIYKINKKGDILNIKKNKILKPQLGKDGYYRNHFLIHRLIAVNFIPNPENLPIIDHEDRNRTNNNINNLRWCTQSDNCKNRKIKGCITPRTRKNNIYYEVNVKTKYLKSFKIREEAEEFLKKYLEENEN